MSQTCSPEQTRESMSVATDRLRQEGRWNEASLFKDQAIKRLRAEGRTKGDAKELAWDEMLAKFPPLPAPKPKADPLSLDGVDRELLDRLAATESDWDTDVRWVYANFRHPAPRIDTAPSLAAWGLLGFARSEPAKFFGQLLPPVLAKASGSGNGSSPDDEPPPSDPGLANLDRMLAAASAD